MSVKLTHGMRALVKVPVTRTNGVAIPQWETTERLRDLGENDGDGELSHSEDHQYLYITVASAPSVNRPNIYLPASETGKEGGHLKIRISDGSLMWKVGYVHDKWNDKAQGGFGNPNGGGIVERRDYCFTFDRAISGPTIWAKDGLLVGWSLQGNILPRTELLFDPDKIADTMSNDIPRTIRNLFFSSGLMRGDIILHNGKYYVLMFNINRGDLYELEMPKMSMEEKAL